MRNKKLAASSLPAWSPPPQYYLDSTKLNFTVRMGSGLGAGTRPTHAQDARRSWAQPIRTLGATAPPQHGSALWAPPHGPWEPSHTCARAAAFEKLESRIQNLESNPRTQREVGFAANSQIQNPKLVHAFWILDFGLRILDCVFKNPESRTKSVCTRSGLWILNSGFGILPQESRIQNQELVQAFWILDSGCVPRESRIQIPESGVQSACTRVYLYLHTSTTPSPRCSESTQLYRKHPWILDSGFWIVHTPPYPTQSRYV